MTYQDVRPYKDTSDSGVKITSHSMDRELETQLREHIQKNPSLSLRWRIASRDLPLKQRYYRSLREYGLSNGVISWVIQHVEWTLPEGSLQEPSGVLTLEFDQKGRACMDLQPYKKIIDTSAEGLFTYAEERGTHAHEGIDSEVMWTADENALYVWTDKKAALSAANSLIYDLARQKAYKLVYMLPDYDKFVEQIKGGAEAFLVSDEHGVVQAKDAQGNQGAFFVSCWEKLGF